MRWSFWLNSRDEAAGGFVRQFAERTAQHHPSPTGAADQAIRYSVQKHFVFLLAVPPLAELHSSRTKGRWSQMPYVAARAPEGWRESHTPDASAQDDIGFEPLDDGEEVTVDARKRAWARLLAKVYEVDPLVCPKCGSEMRVIAVIQDPVEIRDILAHLVKTGRAPPGLDPALLN